MKKCEAIRVALKALGVTGKVRIKYFDSLAVVHVDGKRFGIYDFVRKTFVD